MGRRIFLPIGRGSAPYPLPQTKREELLNRLWHTHTLLPDARTMPVEQLRDYVQAQENKQQSGYYDQRAPSRSVTPATPQQVRGAKLMLKELIAWRKRRENNPLSKRYY